jgi:very-short-patch-repair endonuclease
MARDRTVDAELLGGGWTVIRVWDFEVQRGVDAVTSRIVEALRMNSRGPGDWAEGL